jgi:hypothetical protein
MRVPKGQASVDRQEYDKDDTRSLALYEANDEEDE